MIKNLITRSLSALVFLVIMAGGILWNEWSFMAVMFLILLGSLHEYFANTEARRKTFSPFSVKRSRNLVFVLSIILFAISFFVNGGFSSLVSVENFKAQSRFVFADIAIFFPAVAMLLFIQELYSRAEKPFTNIAWNIMALVYIVLPVLLSNFIFFECGAWVLFATLGLIWVNDAAAYLSGVAFGKTKMFERLSPKKTVEGLVGGIIFTAVAAYLFAYLPIEQLQIFSQIQWMIIAVIMAVAAVFGDLVESLLKRSLQIKDSGKIMPGHGGFLDRFDAFFMAIPFAAMVIWLMLSFQ